MSEPGIYLDAQHRDATIKEAIAALSDERIDDGDYCAQTLIDMRNAMLAMCQRLASAEAATSASYREIDELRAAIKSAGIVLQRAGADLVAVNVPADECHSLLDSFYRNWDCDADAHKYGTPCRCCEAQYLLQKHNAAKAGGRE